MKVTSNMIVECFPLPASSKFIAMSWCCIVPDCILASPPLNGSNIKKVCKCRLAHSMGLEGCQQWCIAVVVIVTVDNFFVVVYIDERQVIPPMNFIFVFSIPDPIHHNLLTFLFWFFIEECHVCSHCLSFIFPAVDYVALLICLVFQDLKTPTSVKWTFTCFGFQRRQKELE